MKFFLGVSIFVFVFGWMCIAAPLGSAWASVTPASEIISRLDQDHDGTLSWEEIRGQAVAEFKKLDRDHEGSIDAKEWQLGHLPQAEWKKVQPDSSGKISQERYLVWVKEKFTEADPDHDGTLDEAELSSSRASVLLNLLK